MTTDKGTISGNREANMRAVCAHVVEILKMKNPRYGDSWKAKGGFSAFFNLDRKWSRVETLAAKHNYDIFAAIRATAGEPDGMLEALGDLMGYIVLTLDETTLAAGNATGSSVLELKRMAVAPFTDKPL